MKISLLHKGSNYDFPILKIKKTNIFRNYQNSFVNNNYSIFSERSTGYFCSDFNSRIGKSPKAPSPMSTKKTKKKKILTPLQLYEMNKEKREFAKIFSDNENKMKINFNVKCLFSSTASSQLNEMSLKAHMISKASNYIFSKITGYKLKLKLLKKNNRSDRDDTNTERNNNINMNNFINTKRLYSMNKSKYKIRNITMYSKYPKFSQTFYTIKKNKPLTYSNN